jgi:hypothetical protein
VVNVIKLVFSSQSNQELLHLHSIIDRCQVFRSGRLRAELEISDKTGTNTGFFYIVTKQHGLISFAPD